ncbi:PREDICTED: uncharacterized protein LOC104816380 [Tarenaya hassleriana]|uniref:uncharacterized protein LOC104816380 n=1 Tax=Tarenaya hassleriana TaxID=28532 RepID=UPI00053CA222|nr:PREDICTED: uncharacterized protein LOC104816380 [Tarenaya hassleriana]
MQTVSVYENKNTVVLKAEHRGEDGAKRIERFELKTRNPETIKHMERKLMDQGVQRMERHPVDGIPLKRPPPKSGHGGKFTWEGPGGVADYELYPDPPAMDKGDPNYYDEEEEVTAKRVGGDDVAAERVRCGVDRV